MKKILTQSLVVLTLLLTLSISSLSAKPLDRGIVKHVFMPKGQWFMGLNGGYTQLSSEDYQFLMIDNLKANMYTAGGRMSVGYTFTNDIAAGISFQYDRTQVKIDDVDIKLSEDMVFSVKDYYSIQHVYTASAFLRTYINIGDSKRFGLFNDLKFNFGGGQGKIYRGTGDVMQGTYEKITKMGVVLSPGVSVFATDFMAVEASIGILGLNYTRTEQITNQVYQSSFESFNADFKINLLSVSLGLTFFF